MFITIEDYAAVCDDRELDVLQNADNSIRQEAEQVALEEVASFLRARYDVAKIYAAQGDDRNKKLVNVVANVVLFYLSKRLPQKMAGAKRDDLYQQAIDWLKLVGTGKVAPDLPAITDEKGNDTAGFPLMWNSWPKLKNDY